MAATGRTNSSWWHPLILSPLSSPMPSPADKHAALKPQFQQLPPKALSLARAKQV